jgi:hypothetical protein
MEIVDTGNLQRIGHEQTEDVEVIRKFLGIYGVGQPSLITYKTLRAVLTDLLFFRRPQNCSAVVCRRMSNAT